MKFITKLKSIASFVPNLLSQTYKFMSDDIVGVPVKYVKKPVVIEAVLFDGTKESVSFFIPEGEYEYEPYDRVNDTHFKPHLKIKTLEGTMTAQVGDYIICGVLDEYYPCKPEIFKATYRKF